MEGKNGRMIVKNKGIVWIIDERVRYDMIWYGMLYHSVL